MPGCGQFFSKEDVLVFVQGYCLEFYDLTCVKSFLNANCIIDVK